MSIPTDITSVLSIAGSDSSGGAGVQADLKTFAALGCYGTSVLTVVTAQNTHGVLACYPVETAGVQNQLKAIFEDIVPDAIKIGALFSAEIVLCVADFLSQHAHNIPIVLDPVMVAKSGAALLSAEAIETLKYALIPLATVLTPNLPEAQQLVPHQSDQTQMGQALLALGCQSVLLKGGHDELAIYTSDDRLFTPDAIISLSAERIISNNTHGTGCTLSAAIAARLAQGDSLLLACQRAKEYLTAAIRAAIDWKIGHGHGPVHHFHAYQDV